LAAYANLGFSIRRQRTFAVPECDEGMKRVHPVPLEGGMHASTVMVWNQKRGECRKGELAVLIA
jgi:hypothetical protein